MHQLPLQCNSSCNTVQQIAHQHKHASEQLKQSDDTTASARVTNMKIEELNDCQRTESCITQLKKIKNSTNASKQQNRGVA